MKGKSALWIPILFTLFYFGFAYSFIALNDSATWLFGLIPLAMAGLSSILLWISFAIWARSPRRPARLLLIAVLLPVVIYGVPIGMLSWQSHRLMIMDAKMKKEASLLDIADEELLTASGSPIGVRLRVQVRYPEGVEPLVPHIPPANLSTAPAPYVAGFWVANAKYQMLNATDYVITSDVVPDFMPQTIRFGRGDLCFDWSRNSFRRADVLHAAPQTFRVNFQEPPYSAPTRAL